MAQRAKTRQRSREEASQGALQGRIPQGSPAHSSTASSTEQEQFEEEQRATDPGIAGISSSSGGNGTPLLPLIHSPFTGEPGEEELPLIVPFSARRRREDEVEEEAYLSEQYPEPGLTVWEFDEKRMEQRSEHEASNAALQEHFIAVLERNLIPRESASQYVGVSRVELGNECNAKFHHTNDLHPFQNRTMVYLIQHRDKGDNGFENWPVANLVDLATAFISQYEFFESGDCCRVRKLVNKSEANLHDACERLVFGLQTSAELDEFRYIITGRMKSMPNRLSATLKSIADDVRNQEMQEHDADVREAERSQRRAYNPPALGGQDGFRQEARGPSELLLHKEIPALPTWLTFLPNGVNSNRMITFARECYTTNTPLRVDDWPKELREAFNQQYRLENLNLATGRPRPGVNDHQWQTWEPKQLLKWLEELTRVNHDLNQTQSPLAQFESTLAKTNLEIDWESTVSPRCHPFVTQALVELKGAWYTLIEHDAKMVVREVTVPTERRLCRDIVKKITHRGRKPEGIHAWVSWCHMQNFTMVEQAINLIGDHAYKEMVDSAGYRAIYGHSSSLALGKRKEPESSAPAPRLGKGRGGRGPPPEQRGPQRAKHRKTCKGCGYTLKEGEQNCTRPCDNDARRNRTDKSWVDSAIGKAWSREGFKALPKDNTITLDNVKLRRNKPLPTEDPNKNRPPQKEDHRGKATLYQYSMDMQLTQQLISFYVAFVQPRSETHGGRSEPTGKVETSSDSALTGRLLLDSGAIGACVVSTEFSNKLLSSNVATLLRDTSKNLLTAINDHTKIFKEISFILNLHTDSSKPLAIRVTALVAPIGVDLILDRQTIKSNDLLAHFPSHFAEGKLLQQVEELNPSSKKRGSKQITSTPTEEEDNRSTCSAMLNYKRNKTETPQAELGDLEEERAEVINQFFEKKEQTQKETALEEEEQYATAYLANIAQVAGRVITLIGTDAQKTSYLNAFTSNFSEKPAFERDGNLTGIPDNKLESIPAELISAVHGENDYRKVRVEGTPLMTDKLRKLIEEFKDIFRSVVQAWPAKLKPFKLEVDKEKWQLPANRLKSRSMDREKEVELNKLIRILLDNNIIEASDDSYYSHAFLVPKPNGKWRLVLDFKNLNDATTNYYKWPLPNILEMLNRVGDSRPKFFAVFDLTSGYYQAPIEEESRGSTAFMTRNGVYRWLRLPMGLTGAGSYFQKTLITEVLNGLMHTGVELYMDDCMVHATSQEDRYRTQELGIGLSTNTRIADHPHHPGRAHH